MARATAGGGGGEAEHGGAAESGARLEPGAHAGLDLCARGGGGTEEDSTRPRSHLLQIGFRTSAHEM